MNFSIKSIIAAVLVAIIGFAIISFSTVSLASEVAFVIGALLTAVILQLNYFSEYDDSDYQPDEELEVTTLYVGNLPYKVSEDSIKEHFASLGYVQSVRLMRDRKTGKRKGFGFVEVASNDAKKMVNKLNDTEFEERTLKVRFAKEKQA